MHELNTDFDPNDKPGSYERLRRQLAALLAGESDLIANAANTSALLYTTLPGVNWVGFYLLRAGELVRGPVQGKPACVRIALGKGVCGTAASQRATVRVGDVHAFPGHIACDPASRAEIVIPLIKAERLVGVLDIDSPELGRFDEVDQRGLEALAAVMINASHA